MRSRKLIAVAYCCLNQNSVLPDWERSRGAYPFMDILVKEGYGIIQLDCPELLSKGLDRPPLAYQDYNIASHRSLCRKLVSNNIDTIKAHIAGGDEFIGIIGIESSPNCAISNQRGVYMEELIKALKEIDIYPKYIEVPETYIENNKKEEENFEFLLKRWLKI